MCTYVAVAVADIIRGSPFNSSQGRKRGWGGCSFAGVLLAEADLSTLGCCALAVLGSAAETLRAASVLGGNSCACFSRPAFSEKRCVCGFNPVGVGGFAVWKAESLDALIGS